MHKYRKKPVVIEAFQMTPSRRETNVEWPQWLHEAWNAEGEGSLYCVEGGQELYIGTKEGVMKVDWGDFIIQGVQGEIYPCKPDIFEATYDKV